MTVFTCISLYIRFYTVIHIWWVIYTESYLEIGNKTSDIYRLVSRTFHKSVHLELSGRLMDLTEYGNITDVTTTSWSARKPQCHVSRGRPFQLIRFGVSDVTVSSSWSHRVDPIYSAAAAVTSAPRPVAAGGGKSWRRRPRRCRQCARRVAPPGPLVVLGTAPGPSGGRCIPARPLAGTPGCTCECTTLYYSMIHNHTP